MRFLALCPLLFLLSCTTTHNSYNSEKGKSRQAIKNAPWKRFVKKEEGTSSKYEGLIQSPDYKRRVAETKALPSLKMPSRAPAVVAKAKPKLKKAAPARVPSLSVLAKELKLSSKELRSQATHLDAIMRGSKNAKKACRGWQRRQNKEMCSFLSALDRKNSSSRKSRYKPYVPISPRNFNRQQKLPYAQVRKSLRKRNSQTVLNWAPQMLKVRGCPRNLSAASTRKLENLLPSKKAQRMLEKLYLHAAHCMKPSHKDYEYFHFRQALLRYTWGEKSKARLSMELAAKAKHHYERERVLYWAGLWAKTTAQQRGYWQELVDDYPLAYQSLEAWRHMGEDPFLIYTQRPDLSPERKVKRAYSQRAQQGIYWLEALYVLKKQRGASRLASRLMRRFQNKYSASNIYYVASLKQEKNNTLATIGFLSGQVHNDSKVLNEQTLKMLFPRPYYRQFKKAEKKSNTNPYLLLAVTRQESAFNPRARSRANARGLMQILPTTARQMTGKRWNNLYSPVTNVQLGAKYMSGLIQRFGAVEKALAAYNAGPSRVNTWNKRYQTTNLSVYMDLIPFRETRNYVSKILRNNYWYERIYQPAKAVASLGAPGLQRSLVVDRLLKSHRSAGIASR